MKKKNIHEGSWLAPILKEGKWYLIASIITKAIGFFLLPIYTEYLTPSEYGILHTLNSISKLLPILISLSLDAAFTRFFHDYKQDQKKLVQLFSTIYWFVVLFGSFNIFIVLVTSGAWLEDFIEVKVYPYAFLAFIPALFLQLGMLGIIFLRQTLQAQLTSVILIGGAILNIIVSLILLIYFDLGVIARLWGELIAAGSTFCITTYYFVKKGILRITFNKQLLRESLIYSIPLIPSVAGNWIAGVSDRLVIAKYVDTAAVGIYSLSFQIAYLLYIIGDAITQVLGPVTMSGLVNDKERTKEKISEFSLLVWIIMLYVSLGLFFFSKEMIVLVANRSFLDAYKIIPLLALPYILGMQYRFFSSIISYYKKTWIFTTASILSALINLGLNIWLVPKFGYIAAVWTTLITGVAYSLYIIYMGYQLEKINLFWSKLFYAFLIYILAILCFYSYFVYQPINLITFSLKTVLFFLVGISFIFIGNYQQIIIAYIKQFLNKKS